MPKHTPIKSTIEINDNFGRARLTLVVTAGSKTNEKVFEIFSIDAAAARSLKAVFAEKTYKGHELSLAIERHGGLRLRMSNNNVNQGKSRVFCLAGKSKNGEPLYKERIEGTNRTSPVKDAILAEVLAGKPMTSRDLLKILPELI